MENTCEWGYLEDDDAWETSCDEMHYLNYGTPEDNRYKFCPYCGQRLTMRAVDVCQTCQDDDFCVGDYCPECGTRH